MEGKSHKSTRPKHNKAKSLLEIRSGEDVARCNKNESRTPFERDQVRKLEFQPSSRVFRPWRINWSYLGSLYASSFTRWKNGTGIMLWNISLTWIYDSYFEGGGRKSLVLVSQALFCWLPCPTLWQTCNDADVKKEQQKYFHRIVWSVRIYWESLWTGWSVLHSEAFDDAIAIEMAWKASLCFDNLWNYIQDFNIKEMSNCSR